MKTLGHERIHAYQAQRFGPPRIDAAAREVAAIASEETWWQFYREKL